MGVRRTLAASTICLALVACGGEGGGSAASSAAASCESLCTSSDACMQALAMEGIAPQGSTAGDRGLCNGICSTLRTMRREHAKQSKDLGLDEEWDHACLPAAGN